MSELSLFWMACSLEHGSSLTHPTGQVADAGDWLSTIRTACICSRGPPLKRFKPVLQVRCWPEKMSLCPLHATRKDSALLPMLLVLTSTWLQLDAGLSAKFTVNVDSG